MKILGNRILVARIKEEETEGFQKVDTQDTFVYKGIVKDITIRATAQLDVKVGDIVYFAKYSPNSQEIPVDGETMKIISVEDIIAIL